MRTFLTIILVILFFFLTPVWGLAWYLFPPLSLGIFVVFGVLLWLIWKRR